MASINVSNIETHLSDKVWSWIKHVHTSQQKMYM